MKTLAKITKNDRPKSEKKSFSEDKKEPVSDKDSLVNDFFYDDDRGQEEKSKVRNKKRPSDKKHSNFWEAVFDTSKVHIILVIVCSAAAAVGFIIGLPILLNQVIADFSSLYKMIGGLMIFFALLMTAAHSMRMIGENTQDEFKIVSLFRRFGGILFIIFFVLFLAMLFIAIVGTMFLYIIS